MLQLGRAVCNDLAAASRREWLVTNGLGGYASGTVAGVNTRRYHGLLVAALRPPVARTVLVGKLDGTAVYDGRSYPLATNAFADGTIDPHGYRLVESFGLDRTVPVWRCALSDALLEVRVFMAHGADTTYVTYTLARGSRHLDLAITALCTYRDHHALAPARWEGGVRNVAGGVEVTAFDGARPYRILADRGRHRQVGAWYRAFEHAVEAERGFDHVEDLFVPAELHLTLAPGETATVVCTAEAGEPPAGREVLSATQARSDELAARLPDDRPRWVHRLALAADQFVVRRSVGPGGHAPDAGRRMTAGGTTIVAGYPWFTDWGRDTMIALPGLTLATGRPEVAADVLRTYAAFVDGGTIPNRFPDAGGEPEYHTVDATLWYVHAVGAYVRHTGDAELARELYPVLRDVVDRHVRGTRHGIRVDPADGLLAAGEPGVQLTWMDAKVGDRVVTPRIGKPVEVNALWHHALEVVADVAERVGDGAAAGELRDRASRVARAFAGAFWNPDRGCLYDVVDGPEGDLGPDGRRRDTRLRPNQILAVSLPGRRLNEAQARAVVDACARHLWTSGGLRSLAPDETGYVGRYAGGPAERDAAYHQGTAWSWLAGSFITAYAKVHGAPAARSFFEPFSLHLEDAGLGTVSEIFDGDPPHRPDGCIAQAWGVGELLRAWWELGRSPS